MYRITSVLHDAEYTIHDPRDPDVQLINPALDLEMGATGNLSFMIAASHPYLDKIPPLSAELRVYENNELIWTGRRLDKSDDFYNTGTINCEGALAYLLDSIQRPYEFTGSIVQFLTKLLEVHNSQVEERKKILLGNVTVIDNNNYINRSNSDFSTTLDAMQEKLVGTHGGFLRIRYESGVKYLDYVTDYGGINGQIVRFGDNLVDLRKKVNPETILTALIPRGATMDDGTVIDITSVNGGKDYIYNADAVETYGWIWGVQTWEDVTIPQNLLNKATAYLNESILLPATIDVSALDLSRVDVDIQCLKLGYWTRIISEPHGLDSNFLLSKRHIDLVNAANDTITLGKTIETFTQSTASNMKEISVKVDRVASSMSTEINQAVENATEIITGGKGGYVVISLSDSGHPDEILVMDAPSKEDAENVIRINRNGIGFSNTGYNGPFNTAWTIDGSFLANYITAGTMYADRIKGGMLTLGGAGNINGAMKILDAQGRQIGVWDSTGILLTSPNGGFTTRFDVKDGTGWSAIVIQEQDPNSYGKTLITPGLITFQRVDTESGTDELQVDMDGMYILSREGDEAQYTVDVYAMYGDFASDVYVSGDFDVSGSKHRLVQTKNYGCVRLSAYETPVPLFGDIGSGIIADDGYCYVWFDPIFFQTIAGNYQVFLQAYGDGKVFVSQKSRGYFVVSGTPGMHFAWEIKAKQAGYESHRLDSTENPIIRQERRRKERLSAIDYGVIGESIYKKYMEGLL